MAVAAAAMPRTRTRLGFDQQIVAVSVLPWLTILALDVAGVRLGSLMEALSFVGAAHVGATATFYLDPEARHLVTGSALRYIVVPVALVVAGVALAFLAPIGVLAVLLVARTGWQVHHFNRQNLGMLSMWARARRMAPLGVGDRRVLDLVGYVAIIGTLVTAAWVPMVQERVWPWRQELCMAGLVVLLVALWLLRRDDVNHAGPVMLAAAYWLPLFVFMDDPASAVLAIGLTHAGQYYLMMAGLRGGRPAAGRAGIVAVTVLSAITLGWFHAAGSTVTSSSTYETLAYGIFLGLGVAHFVADAGMWKMRNPGTRAYLKDRFEFL